MDPQAKKDLEYLKTFHPLIDTAAKGSIKNTLAFSFYDGIRFYFASSNNDY